MIMSAHPNTSWPWGLQSPTYTTIYVLGNSQFQPVGITSQKAQYKCPKANQITSQAEIKARMPHYTIQDPKVQQETVAGLKFPSGYGIATQHRSSHFVTLVLSSIS